jgi:hypothetical protein
VGMNIPIKNIIIIVKNIIQFEQIH